MFTFLMAACGPAPDEAKVRVFCEESVAHFHWLERQGVPFKRSAYPEPSMEPPTDDCLVYSGGEDAYPFDVLTPPVPRAHKPQHPNAAGGFLMQSWSPRPNAAARTCSATRVPTPWWSSATAGSPGSSCGTTAPNSSSAPAAASS